MTDSKSNEGASDTMDDFWVKSYMDLYTQTALPENYWVVKSQSHSVPWFPPGVGYQTILEEAKTLGLTEKDLLKFMRDFLDRVRDAREE